MAKKIIFPGAVFLTGGSVLVLEVVATRVLSPYFGNTIYTVSSIIGVVLAALSLGYYLGGRLADRHPSAAWFYSIIFFSGLAVIGLESAVILFLPAMGNSLSLMYGPLVVSSILFFLPAALLGMLSPYAVKLQQQAFPEEGVGRISGTIFFWSTLGSIAGSLLTGFVFIPNFGIDRIIMGVGLLLALLGFIPLAGYGLKLRQIFLASLGALLFFAELAMLPAGNLAVAGELVYSRDGVYEKLLVVDGSYRGRPTRYFHQDKSNSAAMYLDSDELVFDYTKYYGLHKVLTPSLRTALVIGGGAYSLPKALLNEALIETVDVAEIEPSLYDLGKKYFRLSDDSRLKNHIADGRRFLSDSRGKYDLIFSDVYFSLYSIPVHFTTVEFFNLAKSKLNQNGIFIANLIGNLDSRPPSLIFSEMKTFRRAFPNSYFFAVNSPDYRKAQNIIFVGYNSDKIMDFSAEEIISHSDPIVRQAGAKLIDVSRVDFDQYLELTDNHSPVEYLTARILD